MAAFRHRFGKRDGHALPDAGCTPSSKAPIDRVPIAIFRGYTPPGRAAAQAPQNAVDDIAVVLGGAASTTLARAALTRQQHLKTPPFRFRQIATAQFRLPSRG